MSDREELIRNAVAFLSDPKSQASPLTQRIQFLEAKGLTPPEIDLAIRQAANQSTPAIPGYPFVPYPAQQWDWRDYFITAVVSGTVLYGAVSLFKKYLSPHLQPPDTTVYEDDRNALTAQFDAAEALLKEIQSETTAVKQAVEEQKEKVDKTTKDVEAVVLEMRGAEIRARDEMREVRDEINTIREMLPKMIEKNKDMQTQSLTELQQELKSLKALLLSRGPTMPSAPSPSTMIGRPSIPAWQLASSNGSSNPGLASSPKATTNGKGKEREEFETPETPETPIP
ncbi:peroxisomal membrane anchor protein conserved region-domain-containing protein [Rhodocollybia butyracea]|uniref:Peroxisomal membrane protein PEX14 n=1 Tax=Rhodocollybia butyracea TaxID=206335 RepID=A0A9P5PTZ6_9AGAR|nr:peroxisomal membrane anchor protein conserved region-domain-containing protein [Rhodocollybia butyracea]